MTSSTSRISILICFITVPLLSNLFGFQQLLLQWNDSDGSRIRGDSSQTTPSDLPPHPSSELREEKKSKRKRPRTYAPASFPNNFTLNMALSKEKGYCNGYHGKMSGPARHYLSSDDFLVFHIGKAGGLTARTRLWRGWNLDHEQCHPRPEVCFNTTYPDKYDRRIIFLTLRDPIDRFVSTNQWTLGRPMRDREINPEHLAIYAKYQPTPTASLAEALCNIVNDDGNNNTQRIQLNATVVEDVQNLQHWWTIEQWLGETTHPTVYDWRRHASRLYPIVSERGFDLTAQEDTAVLQVANLQPSLFGDAQDFELRKKKAICYVEANTHNSSQTMGAPPTLSHKAQLCLAHYYQRDYQLLNEVQSVACKSSNCRLAIQSILDRRKELLAEANKLK